MEPIEFGRLLAGKKLPVRGKSGHHKAARPVKAGDENLSRVLGRKVPQKIYRQWQLCHGKGEKGR